MKKSINTKIITVVLAIACVLAFGISAAIVGGYTSTKDGSNAVAQDGDVNGLRGGEKFAQIGTAISNGEQLRNWLNGTATHGYLTQNITWRKTYNKTEVQLASGRVLDGNGRYITASTNDNVKIDKGDTVFGYIVDRNFGTIRNLNVWTGNDVGDIVFYGSDKSNQRFGSSGFQKKVEGSLTMGVIAGVNQGIIDNCSVDLNHYIQNTWADDTEMQWTYAALGGVVGANYNKGDNIGVISNTTVNVNRDGGLMVGVYGKANWTTPTTGRSRVAAVAGMSNTTNGNIVAFKNITVNYNGGIISVAACDQPGLTNLYAATLTTTVSVSNMHNEGSNSETPRVEGLAINGAPDFRALWENHGNRRAALTINQSDGSRENSVYISENVSFPSNFINNNNGGPAHNAKWYKLFSNDTATFANNKLKFTRRHITSGQVIYSVHGQKVMDQQFSQLESGERTVTFAAMSTNGQGVAIDVVMGKTENVTTLNYAARTREFDNNRYNATFRNSQGGIIQATGSGATIQYSGDNTSAGNHTATYTPSGNKVIGLNDSAKTIYVCKQTLTATMTITPKTVGLEYNFDDVYNSYLKITKLLGEDKVKVNKGTYGNTTVNFIQWGYYDISVSKNYIMPAGFPTGSIEVGGRLFQADSRFRLAENTPGVQMLGNTIFLERKLDRIKLTALSNKYGTKISEITGAVNSNVEATNSSYTATIALHKDIVRLGLKEVNISVTATAESNNATYGTATVNKANPTIGETLTYTATPTEGYIFLGWTNDGKYVSFDATFTTIVGMQGKELVAVFADSCNVIILNGDREVGKLRLTENQLASLPNVGGTITAEEANIGNSATLAVDRQAYNNFYGWYVDSITDGVYTLKAVYSEAIVNVDVSIDGEVTEYAINSDITLNIGSYTVNGVSVRVYNVTTLKALAGLTIVSGNVGTAEASATGVYDADKGVVQINAVMTSYDRLSIRLVNTKTNDSVLATAINGRVVASISGEKKIVQAIVIIDQEFLRFAQGRVEARVYAGDVLLSTIVVREA